MVHTERTQCPPPVFLHFFYLSLSSCFDQSLSSCFDQSCLFERSREMIDRSLFVILSGMRTKGVQGVQGVFQIPASFAGGGFGRLILCCLRLSRFFCRDLTGLIGGLRPSHFPISEGCLGI